MIATLSHPSRRTAPASGGGGGGGFAAPDLLTYSDWRAGVDGYTDWTGGSPPSDGFFAGSLSRNSSGGPTGMGSMTYSFQQNAGVPPCAGDGSKEQGIHLQREFSVAGVDRVFAIMYVKISASYHGASCLSVQKFFRFFTTNDHGVGGLWMEDGTDLLNVGFDAENGATLDPFGVTSNGMLIDSAWHIVEVDYWRNGHASGFPAIKVYIDQTLVSFPDGHGVHFQGNPSNAYWENGFLVAGERNATISNGKLNKVQVCGTGNENNSNTGTVEFSNIAFSTQRIGHV